MVIQGRDFIYIHGVISDPAIMDMLLTSTETRLLTAQKGVPKYLSVMTWKFRKNTSRYNDRMALLRNTAITLQI